MTLYALWLDNSDYECSNQTVIAITEDKEIADVWENMSSGDTGFYEFELGVLDPAWKEYQFSSWRRMSTQEYERAIKYHPDLLNHDTTEAINILGMLLEDKSILPQVKDNSQMIRNYECTNCKHKFEREERMGVEAKKKCPKCRRMTLVRKIEANPIHFTGTGFTRKIG